MSRSTRWTLPLPPGQKSCMSSTGSVSSHTVMVVHTPAPLAKPDAVVSLYLVDADSTFVLAIVNVFVDSLA